MPEKRTVKKTIKLKRKGMSPSTQAGEFVREEIHHVRRGKHGARSSKQAIAIGLNKARKAGVRVPRPKGGRRKKRASLARAASAVRTAGPRKPSKTRSRAISKALRREPHRAASHDALAAHARRAAKERSPGERSAAARKAVKTKG